MQYRFPISEGLGCIEDVLNEWPEHTEVGVSAARVMQAAAEQFGIEFIHPTYHSPYEVLMRIENFPHDLAEQLNADIMRVLRRMLPWTEGPPDGATRLIGNLRYTTLRVVEVARDVQLDDVLANLHADDAWLPTRIREIHRLP